MATNKVLTYTLPEVCVMIGIDHETGKNLAKRGKFPFPVIQIGVDKSARYLIPRKHVDDFLLKGKKGDLTGDTAKKFGRPRKWFKGEFVNWNYKIPSELAEAFNITVDAMNVGMASPLSYLDAKLLALQEFIERRPIG